MKHVNLKAVTECGFCGRQIVHRVHSERIDENNRTVRLPWPIPLPPSWDRVEIVSGGFGIADGILAETRDRCPQCIASQAGEDQGWKPIED